MTEKEIFDKISYVWGRNVPDELIKEGDSLLNEVIKKSVAFDIIKAKHVDVVYLLFCIGMADENTHFYNYNEEREPLTDEEYILLKEVFTDAK